MSPTFFRDEGITHAEVGDKDILDRKKQQKNSGVKLGTCGRHPLFNPGVWFQSQSLSCAENEASYI